MFELTIKHHIAAAHFLRDYEGPCAQLHGHTWQIEVTIISEELNEIGLVMDFAELKKRFRSFLQHLDHVCLNDIPYFQEHNPSSEHIARYVYREFGQVCAPLRIKWVRVWESDTAYITYYE